MSATHEVDLGEDGRMGEGGVSLELWGLSGWILNQVLKGEFSTLSIGSMTHEVGIISWVYDDLST